MVKAFAEEASYRFAILFALCQAGKTGTFQELIRLMLQEGKVQRAYILCGSNDTDLREQANKDTATANPEAYARGDVKVIFRQDFKDAHMDIANAIVVVDESHLDQTQKQELDQFLAKHGLSMDGNPATLVEKNTFIVSVDATPYSELAALQHKESYPKHLVVLEPGDGYFGMADYFYGGFLRPTYDVCDKSREFTDMVRAAGNKYAILRLSTGKKSDRLEAGAIAAYRSVGGRVYYHTAEKEEIPIATLSDAPDRPTLVIICGRLRAGKVVPKKHISFVWEGAATSKTDSLVQGLLGRMCGYDVPAERPLIFLPPSSLKRNENKVIKASEIERAIMASHAILPTKATNLKKAPIATAAANGKTQCPPLRLEWDATHFDERGDWHHAPDGEICRAFLVQQKNKDLISSGPFSDKQKQEIRSFIGTAAPHTRTLRSGKSDSFKKYFSAIIEAHGAKTACVEHVSDFGQMTFFITKDAILPHSSKRHLYVVFYTDARCGASPGLLSVNPKSRVAETNKKSVFSIHDSTVDRPLVAGGAVGFDESRIQTPALLEQSLRDYLTLYRDSGLTVQRCIQSNKDRFALAKAAFQYVSPKNNMVESICRTLNAEFGVKMKVTYTRSASTTFNVKKIAW
jgi:hypothetical protein